MKKLAGAWTAPLLSLLVVGAAPGAAAAMSTAELVWTGYQSVDSPAQESRTPTVVMGSKEERAQKAAANYDQNRYVEAALGFEGLWKDYPKEPDFLFNAATCRFSAGHFAHVIAYTNEYLAGASISAEARKAAEVQLRSAVAQAGTMAVTVTVDAPAVDAGVMILAQYIPRDSGDVRPELLFKGTAGVATVLQLDPGFWTVRAQAADHVTAEQRVEVSKGQSGALDLRLVPAPKEVQPPKPEVLPEAPREVPLAVIRRQKLGFGVVGGVVAVAGIGVTVAGSVKLGNAKSCDSGDSLSTCTQSLASALTVRATGLMLLGGGVGLVAGSLPWLARDAKVRKKVWIAETVVGVAAVVAGVAISSSTTPKFNAANSPGAIRQLDMNDVSNAWSIHYEDNGKKAVHAVNGLLLGLGAGMVVSSVTGLLVQDKYLRGVRVSATAGRGQAGLVLSGRF